MSARFASGRSIVWTRLAAVTIAGVACLQSSDGAAADELAVVAAEPSPRTVAASIHSPITIEFDQPVDPSTVHDGSFRAWGRWSGAVVGTFAFENGDTRVTLTPDRPLSAGEMVFVVLSHDLRAADGDPLRDAGYSFQYWTAPREATMTFTLSQDLSTRTGSATTTYGAIGTDLDNDGWLDITTMNEETDDVRVFMNTGDGQGTYGDLLEPPQSVGEVPSPSEPADFNGDGFFDVCIANTVGDSVSVLLGAGDGTWLSHQEIDVGETPRGIAVLDADGDGDLDIANTNAGSGNVSILLNDGEGVFGAPTFFEGGGSGEWALAAADMNEDGVLDLVVGARSSREIAVLLGNGDSTFTLASVTPSGGRTWMIATGDVNGDGHDDVAAVNSSNNNGAILLGDGRGGLAQPTTYSTDPFPLATDLGDLDGDGDLDWVTSSFGGDWWVFENDGAGGYTVVDELDAPSAASCCTMLDIDNDRDLDLALIDELADRLIIRKNDGTSHRADVLNATVLTGVILEGDAASLRNADDSRLHTRSGFGQTFVDLHSMELLVAMRTFAGDPALLDITIRSRIDEPSGTARVSLRNWKTGEFDAVGAYSIGTTEEAVTIEAVDASDYVNTSGGGGGGEGEIDLQLRHVVFVPFLAFTFESFIDHVQIAVE